MPADDDSDGRPRYRQKDVLALPACGLTAAESAHVLGVSLSTVEHERAALQRTLAARSAPHLVAIAYETGVLPLERARQERLQALIRTHLPRAAVRVLVSGREPA